MHRLRTLHVALRVTDINRSLAFYTALGYTRIGHVTPDPAMRLDFLKFPDDPFVTLELVHRPGDGPVLRGDGFHHLVVQVDTLATYRTRLIGAGLDPEPIQYPAGPDGPQTAWLTDPDGYRIEVVEWPPEHADVITAVDMP